MPIAYQSTGDYLLNPGHEDDEPDAIVEAVLASKLYPHQVCPVLT